MLILAAFSVDVLASIAASAGVALTAVVAADAWRRRATTHALTVERDRALIAGSRLRDALLRHADLSDADLVGLDLHDVVLREKKLRGTDFSRGLLAGCDLSAADCTHARFRAADMTSARCLATNLTEADLGGAKLQGASLDSAILTRASLRDADLTGASLVNADLTGALLAGADLRGADLTGTVLTGADLEDARMDAPGREAPQDTLHTAGEGAFVLPIYVAVDVSASMAGASIEAVNLQLTNVVLELRANPVQADLMRLSVIEFSDSAEVVVPLSPIDELGPLPPLQARGATAYGPLFDLLRSTIDWDVAQLKSSGMQVHRPVVFFITDGEPVDPDWEVAFEKLASESNRWHPRIVALGVGAAGPQPLFKIGTTAAFMATRTASVVEALRELTSSITSTVTSGRPDGMATSLPAVFERIVPLDGISE